MNFAQSNANKVVCKIANNLKNVVCTNKLIILYAIIIIMVVAVGSRAEKYEFRGEYPVSVPLLESCPNCSFSAPADFLAGRVLLNVKTDNAAQLQKALAAAARGNGWVLTFGKKSAAAVPLVEYETAAFISCLDNSVHEVQKRLLATYRTSDSLQCVKRDSLAVVDSLRRDSLRLSLDSAKHRVYKNYVIRYMQGSRGAALGYGVKWSDVLASGNLRGHFDFYDNWQAGALRTNDTSFITRSVAVSVDTLTRLSWGNEQQNQTKTYTSGDGFLTTEYEWRQYGLDLTLAVKDSALNLVYAIRDAAANNTNLSGAAAAKLGDTLEIVGEYTRSFVSVSGVPLLSAVPFLGALFRDTQRKNDVVQFVILVIPWEKSAGTAKISSPLPVPPSSLPSMPSPTNPERVERSE